MQPRIALAPAAPSWSASRFMSALRYEMAPLITAVATTTNSRTAGLVRFMADSRVATVDVENASLPWQLGPERDDAPPGHRDRALKLLDRLLAGVAEPDPARPPIRPGQVDRPF